MTHKNEKFIATYTCSPQSYSVESHLVGVFSSYDEAEAALKKFADAEYFKPDIIDVIEGVSMDVTLCRYYE